MSDRALRLALGCASFALLLLAWHAMSALSLVKEALVPTPLSVFATAGELLRSGAFFRPLLETLAVLSAGYGIGSALGVALGVAMGCSHRVYCLLEPLLEALRPLPKPVLVPIFFLVMGPGAAMKTTMVALTVFFPVLINTLQGVRGVDPVLLGTARTLGLSRADAMRKLMLPAALPLILAGMRVSLGLGLVVVILAEMLEADSGVGFQILDLQRAFQVREMYSWIGLLALVGLALNAALENLERRLVPWKSK